MQGLLLERMERFGDRLLTCFIVWENNNVFSCNWKLLLDNSVLFLTHTLLPLTTATSELKLTILPIPAGKQKELCDAWKKQRQTVVAY